MKEKTFPMSDHPYTLALIAGSRARSHDAMRQAMVFARQIARELKPTEVEQCKLAAEVLIEREMK